MHHQPDNIDPEEMMMKANLREFGQRIAMICALEEGGKLEVEDAYDRIKSIWHKLKKSKKHLLHKDLEQNPDIDSLLDDDFPYQDDSDDDLS